MNLVAADVRRLILFRLKEVGASSRRLLRFRGSMREIFRVNLSLRVRGSATGITGRRWTIPRTVELDETSGEAGGPPK